jgi:hypothetical protein
MQERVVAHVRRLLPFLLWAVTCVLLIAYLNVPNLPLARAEGRRREVAVRATLSAGRWQITRQFVIESLLLSVCEAVVGLAFAAWGTDILIRMAGNIPRIQAVRVNSAVLAFAAALSILTGVAVGLALAFSSRRIGLAQAMQAGGRSSTAGRSAGVSRCDGNDLGGVVARLADRRWFDAEELRAAASRRSGFFSRARLDHPILSAGDAR